MGTHTVLWTATNSLGLTATDTQTVTVTDTTPPVFRNTPRDVFTSSATYRLPVSYDTPTARDIFDFDVVCDPKSGSGFMVGTTRVMCTVTDDNGNTAETSFSVHVTRITDTVAPVITAPPDVTFEATAVETPLTFSQIGNATATDDKDPSPRISQNAPDKYSLGPTRVTWTATDGAGNTATAEQTVTVRDTTPPSFGSGPPDVTVKTLAASETVTYDEPEATDIFGIKAISCTPPSGDSFVMGTTAVTCTATDTNDNTKTVSFDVIVTDDTPPVVTPPPNVTVEATTRTFTPVNIGTATVIDDITENLRAEPDPNLDAYPVVRLQSSGRPPTRGATRARRCRMSPCATRPCP